MHKLKAALLPYLSVMILALIVSPETSSGDELRNPRLQRSLQMLEVARIHLDGAVRLSPPELRDGARDALGRVDAAAHEIHEELEFLHTPRQIEPGRTTASDRPIRAARDALAQAYDELTRDLRDVDIKGRVRVAVDQTHAALDIADRMARREEVLLAAPPPPPVVELRHPRLQRSLQILESAREHLDAAERHSPPEWRDEAHIAREDVNAAIHDVLQSLAAAGAPRVIEVGHAEPTDHPIHAAMEELRQAIAELTTVAGPEFHGYERRAIDRAHLALDDLERLAHRE